MTLTHINWLAVLVSVIVAFISGGIWFSPKAFYPVWWRAMGHKEGEIPGAGMNMGIVFSSTFIAVVIQAVTMASIIELIRTSGVASDFGILDGAATGLIVGVGIAAASSLSHRLFGGHGFKVWLLEVSSDVLNLVLMGAILAAWH